MKSNFGNIKKRICCIFNVAPHYNASIYKLMDQDLNCDFYLGEKIHTPIKLMNYNELKGFKNILNYVSLSLNFYWQKDAIKLVFKDYSHYILTGEVYCLSNWLILFLCKFSSKKVYLWSHGWYGNESLFKKIFKKIFFKLADHILLYGDYSRDLMIKEKFNSSTLTCIYNSMDYENQLRIRKSLTTNNIYNNKFGNNNPVLIYVGRIQKSKKLDLLVESICNLKKQNFKLNLIIVGDDVENTGIEKSIISSGCEKEIWLYGPCYNECELGDLFFNADICVSPGNVGLTAVHSLMYGTPVITHNNFSNQGPEFEAIEEGTTGHFFTENQVSSLSETIVKWLSTSVMIRETIRLNSYKKIDERYNPNIQIETLKIIFGEN